MHTALAPEKLQQIQTQQRHLTGMKMIMITITVITRRHCSNN